MIVYFWSNLDIIVTSTGEYYVCRNCRSNGLEFRETDSESNYWFEFNGKTILVMCVHAKDLKEATECAAGVVFHSLGKILAERM